MKFLRIPRLTVNNDGIDMSGQWYDWSDIKEVGTAGLWPARHFWQSRSYGMRITVNDKLERIYLGSMYSNIWQVQSYIENLAITKQADIRIVDESPVDPSTLEGPPAPRIRYYKTPLLFTFPGIMFFTTLSFAIFSFQYGELAILGVMTFFSLGFLLTLWMNYFGLSSDQLIVRHHIFLLRWDSTPLRSIRKARIHIIFDGPRYKIANRLTMYLKDGSVKSYQADALSDRKWIEFRNDLRNYGIEVIDEIYYPVP